MTTAPPEQDSGQESKFDRASTAIQRFGTASVVFAILAAIFGVTFAVVTPPFWGHDEITQFGRAYQVAHGGILPQEIEDSRGVAYGGDVPKSIDDLMGYALRDYTDNPAEPGPMVFEPGRYSDLESAAISDEQKTIWFTNTAAYSPVPYIPAAVGIWTAEVFDADVGTTILLTRLAGLVAYLLIVAFALRALRERRVQWLAFTVALLPIAVFQAGTVTADTLTNALAMLVSVLIVKALFVGDDLSKVERAALLLSVLTLPLCKPTYILLAMLVVVVPPERLGLACRLRWLPWGFAAVGGVMFLIWTKISAPTTEGMGRMRPEKQWYSVVPSEQLKGILSDPIHFASVFGQSVMRRDHEWFAEFFGELGFAYINVPATTIVACLLAIVISLGVAERMVATQRRTVLVLLALLATVAMIYVTLYLSFTPVGYFIIDGVQGRYFVPLAVIGFAVALRWFRLRLTDESGGLSMRGPAIAVIAATVVSLAAAVTRYYTFVWG